MSKKIQKYFILLEAKATVPTTSTLSLHSCLGQGVTDQDVIISSAIKPYILLPYDVHLFMAAGNDVLAPGISFGAYFLDSHALVRFTSLMSALLFITPGDTGPETASLSCTK